MTATDELRFTLLTDGSSDAVLTAHLEWLLRQHCRQALQPQWAELRRLPQPPRQLGARIRLAAELFPCDVLFVHRDAELEQPAVRMAEIQQALGTSTPPTVCVVPVRMQETWLLFDEAAIRKAAGNPRGRTPLSLPRVHQLEDESNPKAVLHSALRAASGLAGRRLKDFAPARATRLVGQYSDDFSPLRALSAFRSLESDIEAAISANGWQ